MVASSRAQRILFVVLVALLTAIAVVLLIGPASSSTTPIAGSRFDGPTFPAPSAALTLNVRVRTLAVSFAVSLWVVSAVHGVRTSCSSKLNAVASG